MEIQVEFEEIGSGMVYANLGQFSGPVYQLAQDLCSRYGGFVLVPPQGDVLYSAGDDVAPERYATMVAEVGNGRQQHVARAR